MNKEVYKAVNKVNLMVFNSWLMVNNLLQTGGTTSLQKLQQDYQQLLVGGIDDYDFQDEEEQYKLVMLDTGMVTHLTPNNHKDLLKLLKSVVLKD